MDLSIFASPEAWISLVTLIFLEIVLGVDNIVFISITSNRLPEEKQHIGRKLGLAGAMLSRCIFLCFASYLVHMVAPLFTIDLGFFAHGFSVRDIVLLLGGAYLIYKGIDEMCDVLALTEEKASHSEEHKAKHQIGLGQAIGTIMVMDIVDPISDFIYKHTEMKILALCFISVIGILLVLDSLGINSGIEVLDMHMEKLMVYFAMVFAFVLELIQMRWSSNFAKWKQEVAADSTSANDEAVEKTVREEAFADVKAVEAGDASKGEGE